MTGAVDWVDAPPGAPAGTLGALGVDWLDDRRQPAPPVALNAARSTVASFTASAFFR